MNYLQFILWIWFVLKVIDAKQITCLSKPLANGRIRYSNHGNKLLFYCNNGYQRIGNYLIRCSQGQWNGNPPVCAKSDCTEFSLLHGKVTYLYSRSIAEVECDSDFNVIGSPFMYCDTQGWNDTIPECQANSIHQFDICTFESGNTKQCNWIIKSMIFNWVVVPLGSYNSSYIPNGKLPPYDHTLGPQQKTGHVLYLEPMFLPSMVVAKFMKNKQISAQYISPLFPAFEEMADTYCLIFYLYANEHSNVTLEVFVGDEVIWSVNDNLVSEWVGIKINLPFQLHSFRIRIEGKAANFNVFSGVAIDDLRIASGLDCKKQMEVPNSKSIATSTTIQSTVSTTSEESSSTTSEESSSNTLVQTTDVTYEISSTTSATSLSSTSTENNSYFINMGVNQNDSNHLSEESIMFIDENILDEIQHITKDSEYNNSGVKRYREKEMKHPLVPYFDTETNTPSNTVNSSSIVEAYENSSVISKNISIQQTNVTLETSTVVIRNNDVSQVEEKFAEKIGFSDPIENRIHANYETVMINQNSSSTPKRKEISRIHENYKTMMINLDSSQKRDLDLLFRKESPNNNVLQTLVWGVLVGGILLALLLIAIIARKYYSRNFIFINRRYSTKFYKNVDIELDFRDKLQS